MLYRRCQWYILLTISSRKLEHKFGARIKCDPGPQVPICAEDVSVAISRSEPMVLIV